jgi:aminoglycoside phosphotransferase
MKNTGLSISNEASKPYTVDDLSAAMKDRDHAKSTWQDKANHVKSKREALASFEREEAEAMAKLEEHNAKVKRIAANLER